jgi:hypothetical protein
VTARYFLIAPIYMSVFTLPKPRPNTSLMFMWYQSS